MEAHAALRRLGGRRPAWLTGLLPLVLLAGAIAAFVALGAPGLERRGVPAEELAVAATVLRPGEIRLELRNDGSDPVQVAQTIVNDRFVPFTQGDSSIGRLDGGELVIEYPWIEGESYEVALLTSTGGTIETEIEAATATPQADAGFLGLMALIGVYVGVIPVAIGMVWLPWVRRIDARWIQFVLALTVGLLAFLGIDAMLEGVEIAGEGPQAFGGAGLVFLGAVVSYLALAGIDAWVRRRTQTAREAGRGGFALALLIALGIGLRDPTGRLLHPLAVGGLISGLALMYVTVLAISV